MDHCSNKNATARTNHVFDKNKEFDEFENLMEKKRREFVLPDRKDVLRGYAREVDWDARAKRLQREALGQEDDQQLQVIHVFEGCSFSVWSVIS